MFQRPPESKSLLRSFSTEKRPLSRHVFCFNSLDYDSDFRYERSPLSAVKSFDAAERVIYIGTFSKSIGAGLRLGYVIVPPQLIQPTVAAKALANSGHPWLDQAVMAEFPSTTRSATAPTRSRKKR